MTKPEPGSRAAVSRRTFLSLAAGVAALPFALAIPSEARQVVTEWDRRKPFHERELLFRTVLARRLAKVTTLADDPPPPKADPPRQTHSTTYDTAIRTSSETASACLGNMDDVDFSDSTTDGSVADYKEDEL